MAGQTRDLLPWEARCGCPTCKVKPRERCITMDSRYPPNATVAGKRVHLFGDGTYAPGAPTTAHKARYQLWCWLWCRTACNNLPSGDSRLIEIPASTPPERQPA